MGFIAHEQLAAAVTNAGGLGVLGASPDPAGSLPVMVERLRALTSGPFGVDLICADTGFGPASTDVHIDACVQLDVPLVVFHHDPPPARWVSALRAAGIRCVDAGLLARTRRGRNRTRRRRDSRPGQRGRWPRPRTHPVARAVSGRSVTSGPTCLLLGAGGISDGTAAAAALRAGADGVWVGTALVAAVEANAHPEYKRRLIDSPGKTVAHHRLRTRVARPALPPSRHPRSAQRGGKRSRCRTAEHGTIGRTRLFPHSVNMPYDMPIRSALPPTPETSGDWESMAYPAGEGVGAVRRTAPAAEIIGQMMSQAYDILATEHPLRVQM